MTGAGIRLKPLSQMMFDNKTVMIICRTCAYTRVFQMRLHQSLSNAPAPVFSPTPESFQERVWNVASHLNYQLGFRDVDQQSHEVVVVSLELSSSEATRGAGERGIEVVIRIHAVHGVHCKTGHHTSPGLSISRGQI